MHLAGAWDSPELPFGKFTVLSGKKPTLITDREGIFASSINFDEIFPNGKISSNRRLKAQ